MKFRRRQQQKIMADRSQSNVSAYGGLGSHGLDFGLEGFNEKQTAMKVEQELEGSFSRVAQQYATLAKKQMSPEDEMAEEDEDDLLVNADLENEIQEKLASVDVDFP